MMKKIFTALFCACLAAAISFASLSALAEPERETYPDIFDNPLTFGSLVGFAYSSDTSAAFADEHRITLLTGDDITEFDTTATIADVDCENGKFYYSVTGGTVYALPENPGNMPGEVASHTMQHEYESGIYAFGEYGYEIREGKLTIWGGGQNIVTKTDGRYFGLKKYGEKLYILMETEGESAECTVWQIDGMELTQKIFNYSNYDKLTQIPADGAALMLKEFEVLPKRVELTGASLTEISLDNISETDKFFNVQDPKAATSAQSGSALLLAETDIAAIVAIGSRTYITDKANTASPAPFTFDSPDRPAATANCGEWVYSNLFISPATRLVEIRAGEKLTVLNKIAQSAYPQLAHDFYLVQNADDVKGYVCAEFLNLTDSAESNEGGASTLPDRDPQYADNVRTVVLVLVVVLLVLVAAGYLIWLGTHGKKRTVKSDDEDPDTDGKEE